MFQSLLKLVSGLSVAKIPEILLSRSAYLTLDSMIACAAIWRANQSRSSVVLGAMFLLCGVALRCLAVSVRWDRNLPSIAGVYRYLRAPYLSGSAMIWCGLAFAARDLSLLIAVICLVGVLAGFGLLRYERASIRSEESDRMLYVRDVPLLLPQALGFRVVKSGESGLGNVGGSNVSYINREWPGIVINAGILLCLFFSLRYLSLHAQLAATATMAIIAILAYRTYLDLTAVVRESSAGRFRI